jgi:Holliday junction resolvase
MNSKDKGSRVEREVANLFSKRFDETFRRVPASGAHGTNLAHTNIREDAKEILTGDIIAPKKFAFSIEVKSRQDFNFWDLLNRETKNEIDEWIEQAEQESIIAKKKMLIVVKINNKKMFAVFNIDETSIQVKDVDILYKNTYGFMRLDYFLSYDNEFFFQ